MKIGYSKTNFAQTVAEYEDTYTILVDQGNRILFYDIAEDELSIACEKANNLSKIFGEPEVYFNNEKVKVV